MRTFLSTAMAIATALVFISCNIEVKTIKGSGNVTTQKRNLSGFTNVQAHSGMDVIIEQGEGFDVTVEADDNVIDHIMTQVEGQTLVVSSDMNNFMNVTKRVTVKMPAIQQIETHGGASVSSKSVLRGDSISIDAGGGSSVDLQVEADKITVGSSGGASIDLKGMALTLQADASGGGSLSADELTANDVTAHASGGGSIDVRPAVSLTANASSGGSIDYAGDPKKVTIEEHSGGSVSKQ